ncbi:hypothetical protein ACHAWU_009298 [Discostella pseudostelligera]|uniref:Uncharacterized protein n=1 Tax=Discostella pseudostelligera TaxID=259834 RepID=A0ABD3M243_9STRA
MAESRCRTRNAISQPKQGINQRDWSHNDRNDNTHRSDAELLFDMAYSTRSSNSTEDPFLLGGHHGEIGGRLTNYKTPFT